jgi:hypothetical protein
MTQFTRYVVVKTESPYLNAILNILRNLMWNNTLILWRYLVSGLLSLLLWFEDLGVNGRYFKSSKSYGCRSARFESVWGEQDIDPLILNLDTKCNWVVTLRPSCLSPLHSIFRQSIQGSSVVFPVAKSLYSLYSPGLIGGWKILQYVWR